MPVFEQRAFIGRALASLATQTRIDWSLTIVDDGSRDGTVDAIAPWLADPRVTLVRLPENRGLGAALNVALDAVDAPLVAYLPADDVWYAEHLERLVGALDAHPDCVLAHAGVRHHYNRLAETTVEGEGLQLVQCLHRRTGDRWMTRGELVTDDLERMFWSKLRARGAVHATREVTCEWVDHPHQRHKMLREPAGGIAGYRQRYRVREPLRFHSTAGNLIDEVGQYAHYRSRPRPRAAPDGLRILLVGELAYNADRILALEEAGHTLFGLWMREPYWYNAVGPLPFGHVEDLDPTRWREEIRRVQPDVIYALLNWQAVPFAHEVLAARTGVPFVWHFKEGPFICREKGTWRELAALYAGADALIHCSPEIRHWVATLGLDHGDRPELVLDGDLPKRDWFDAERSPLLSDALGGIHTVVPGRPIGLHPHTVAELAQANVHLHFYGDFTQGQWRAWIEKTRSLAPAHLHLHENVDARGWVHEFSRYDAGWLHFFESRNRGDIARADWDDLNYPARIATLAAAGLPMLQRDNAGSIVATQTLARERDLGLFFDDMPALAAQLHDRVRLDALRGSVWRQREAFTFDAHVPRLTAFLREVVARTGRSGAPLRRIGVAGA